MGLILPTQIGINLADARDALTRTAALGRIREADLAAVKGAEEIFSTHLLCDELRGDWIVKRVWLPTRPASRQGAST
jgi:hypothetical protein